MSYLISNNNLIVYVSSRNNYDMLSGEVLKNINTEGFEFINVDDKSSSEEIEKGKKICQENDIVFLENTLHFEKESKMFITFWGRFYGFPGRCYEEITMKKAI